MDYKQAIKQIFAKDKDLDAVIVYGSLVDGQGFNDESDIDIAFLPKGKVIERLEKYARLRSLNRKIDLVNLKRINPTLGMQIIKRNDPLIMNNQAAWDAWKTQVLTQYHDLKISNRNIIKDLGKYSPLELDE